MGRLKITEQNLVVRTGKSEAKVTNNQRLRLSYCTAEANNKWTRSIVRPVLRQQSFLSTFFSIFVFLLYEQVICD